MQRQVDDSFLVQAMRPVKGRRKPERSNLASKSKRERARRKAKALRNVTRRP